MRLARRVLARARRVRLLVMDVDGVLTDGRMILSERGDELKERTIDALRDALALAVRDAAAAVVGVAHAVTRAAGGQGAVRECVELILKAQGSWQRTLRGYVSEHGGR